MSKSEVEKLLGEKLKELRQKEKATNTETIADAGVAQTAVAQALVVLQEFYAKAGEATALVQEKKQEPEIFDAPYKGMGGASGGVIGMLEVCLSDFARLNAETTEAENAAQDAYDKMKAESEQDVAVKTTEMNHKRHKSEALDGKINDLSGDLDGTQKELDAALAYYEKLKPSCVDSGDRKSVV